MSSDWRIATAAHEKESTVWLGLGTNVGDRRANLVAAAAGLAILCSIEAVSSVYESEPVGVREQADFWNVVVRARTRLDPAALMEGLLSLETQLGRHREVRWGPRTIDIDLLLYASEVIDETGLRVPHPRMLERGFVMLPLNEIDPDVRHPVQQERIADLIAVQTFERNRRLFPGSDLLEAAVEESES